MLKQYQISDGKVVESDAASASIHVYINPDGREIHPDAQAVHGISAADLAAMGSESRRVYESRFHPDRVVRDHLEAYDWLMQNAVRYP